MAQNPKLVVEAFTRGARKVGAITLRPITMGTILVLEKIKCPLVDDSVIAAAKKNKGKFAQNLQNDDVARLIFVLAHTGRESLALLQDGDAAFAAAVLDFMDKIPVSDMPLLGSAITEHFSAAFSTVVGGAAAAEKKTEILGVN